MTLYSLIPRGIRRFFSTFTTTQEKPLNDTYDLFLTATLPVGFAYLLRSVVIKFAADTATDFEQVCEVLLTRGIPGQGVTSQVVHLEVTRFTPATATQSVAVAARDSLLASFAGPFWSTQPLAAALRLHLANVDTPAMAAGIVDSHVEFLEYDLNQAQRYWINTPIPTLQR